jgi:hypothetical protein
VLNATLATTVIGEPHAAVRIEHEVVRSDERVPVALVPASNGFTVYDARGVALPIDLTSVTVDAPVLMQRDTALLRLLGAMRTDMPTLYARVSMVSRAGRDELILQLRTAPVRTMQDVTLERLAELEPVEADLVRKQLRDHQHRGSHRPHVRHHGRADAVPGR